MKDRNFKLRQMFNDYLDCVENDIPFNRPPPPLAVPRTAAVKYMSEEERRRVTVRRITVEEMEIFHGTCLEMRPILIREENDYDLQFVCDPTPEELHPIGKRICRLFTKFKILEAQSFKASLNAHVRLIRAYFVDVKEEPSEKLVLAFDHCLLQAIQQLVNSPDNLSNVDNEMRDFLRDPVKLTYSIQSRRVLLDTLLKQPEFLPSSWGGDETRQRLRVAKLVDQKQRRLSRETEMRSGSWKSRRAAKKEASRKALKLSREEESSENRAKKTPRRGSSEKVVRANLTTPWKRKKSPSPTTKRLV